MRPTLLCESWANFSAAALALAVAFLDHIGLMSFTALKIN